MSHKGPGDFGRNQGRQGFRKGFSNPSKKARTGGPADDAEEAVAEEEPVAEAVPPTPVAAPVQRKEKSPLLVSPPPLSRSKAAARRPHDTARSVSIVK